MKLYFFLSLLLFYTVHSAESSFPLELLFDLTEEEMNEINLLSLELQPLAKRTHCSPCPIAGCQTTRKNNRALYDHLKEEHSDAQNSKIFMCEDCKIATIFRNSYHAHLKSRKHLRIATKNTLAPSPESHHPNTSTRAVHTRTRTNYANCPSVDCGASLHNGYNLFQHLQEHHPGQTFPNNPEFFLCTDCKYAITTANGSEYHISKYHQHTATEAPRPKKQGRVNAVCPLCKAGQGTSERLYTHLRDEHEGEFTNYKGLYICDEHEFATPAKRTWNFHISNHHPNH